MAYEHVFECAQLEDSRHLAVEDAACVGTRLSLVINTFVVEYDGRRHMRQSEAALDAVRSSNGYRQSSLIVFQVAVQLLVLGSQPTRGC